MNKWGYLVIGMWFVAMFSMGMLSEKIIHVDPVLDKQEQKNWLVCGSAFGEAEIKFDKEYSLDFKWESCNKIINDKFVSGEKIYYLCEECEDI